jgi:hypothetical protein
LSYRFSEHPGLPGSRNYSQYGSSLLNIDRIVDQITGTTEGAIKLPPLFCRGICILGPEEGKNDKTNVSFIAIAKQEFYLKCAESLAISARKQQARFC